IQTIIETSWNLLAVFVRNNVLISAGKINENGSKMLNHIIIVISKPLGCLFSFFCILRKSLIYK
ncbi:hypothetical protein, partial [Desulfurobacterium crinifex]